MDHNRADGHATDSASRDGPAGALAGQATMRRSNPALVPRHVSANSPCSRSAVTVATGPDKATVTSPVNETGPSARELRRQPGCRARPGRLPGHAMIDPSGERCRCGRVGCWETEVGPAAPARMATPNRPCGTGPQAVRDPEERPAEIEHRRAGGDPHAEVGRWLGIGAALFFNLSNPRVTVLGGSFARLAAPLIPAARRQPARTGMSDDVERCRFGAAGAVVERVLSDPTSISIRTSPAVGVIEGTPTVCSPPLVLTRPRPPHLPPV